MKIPESVFDISRKILSVFLDGTSSMPYESAGILPSELLMFCGCCEVVYANQVIESGRRNGFSTKVLSQMNELGVIGRFTSIEIDPIPSVDEQIEKQFPNTKIIVGDSTNMLPHIAKKDECALLMDGPKGPTAINLIRTINPAVGAIHDLHRYSAGGELNQSRILAEKVFPDAFFSDQEDWVEEFGCLDEKCLRGEYSSREEMTKCGFTLMVRFGTEP